MDLTTFEWLLTSGGAALIAVAEEAVADADGDPVAAAEAVRRRVPEATAEHRAAALTQVTLRMRAVPKFGPDALRLWFTPDALEQATRLPVAAHRAGRLAAAIPGGSVIDLGCSIGGDLLAFARAGLLAAGIESDPVRAAMARANLAALDLPGAVQVADATQVDPTGFDAAFADPARRGARGRVFDVEGWTPPWSWVLDLLRGRALVKVAPGLPHDLIPASVEAEWVSHAGEVKEAVLWSGSLATASRRATVIPASGGLASLTEEDDPYAGGERPVRPVGAFLYEPDGAVIRAGLVTAVAAGVDGALLDPHIAYVTSEAAFHTPFARSYRVIEQLPYREKQLRAALQERGIGRLTIKKRGVDVVPEALRKRLALRGDDEATLVLTRVAGEGTALLVHPF
ncbi:MAG: SAM-dependent methyltransferase [Nocardioides sp.]|nr:SAM-dependent methyltransferase [Nocardioides sp.]